jgi:hypothetical protein
MANYLRRSELLAEAATAKRLIDELPADDVFGRLSLESRQEQVVSELTDTTSASETLASTALYFSGDPVIGSVGIEATFASAVLTDYKDLIVKLWATKDSQVASRGPVPDQDSARLHVTSLLHGSIGFLLEEIDLKAIPMFPTPLKVAADEAADLIIQIATESELQFSEQLETLHPRTFGSVQQLFKLLHRSRAGVRIVDSRQDKALDRESIDRGYVRLEQAQVEEDEIREEGLLQGIIPEGGRFEFRRTNGELLEGKVAPTLSEAYLRRLEREQAMGRWFLATIRRKEIRRFSRSTVGYTLLDLQEVIQPDPTNTPSLPPAGHE